MNNFINSVKSWYQVRKIRNKILKQNINFSQGSFLPVEQHSNDKKTACTIVSLNYLPLACVLGDSFLSHNPSWEFKIFLVDQYQSLENLLAAHSISKHEIIPVFALLSKMKFDILDMILKYNVIELNTAIKPFCLHFLFESGYQKVIYFDPDIYITDTIQELDNLLDAHPIVLTPHILEPIPDDDKKPSELDILMAGVFNLGFIGLSDCTESRVILKWWQKRLQKYCFMKVAEGMHVDQNWINFIPCFSDSAYILHKKSYNVAYWNLHERVLTNRDNKYFIDTDPLQFFHFSGYNPRNPTLISKHQNRSSFDNRKDLKSIFST
jgi:hypothetical protein